MTDDLETRLTTLLRERADSVAYDPDVCRARLAAAPPPPAGRRFVAGALGLGLAAGLASALVIGNGWLPGDRPSAGGTTGGGTTVAWSVSDVPTAGAHSAAALAGTWRIARMDGRAVAADADEGTITLAESGWWRVDASCVAVGGWFTWDPATGSFSPGDYAQPDTMPPAKDEPCYRPSILGAIWPGMRLVRDGADLRVIDGQDKEYLRLAPTADAVLIAPRSVSELGGTYRVTGAWLGGHLQALPGSAARVSLGPMGDELHARFGPAECLSTSWTTAMTKNGRLSDTRSAGMADGNCSHPLTGPDVAAEQPFMQAQSVAVATSGPLQVGGDRIDLGGGDDVVLLGDEGQVLMTMTRTSTPIADSEPVAARAATPNDVIGDWRLAYLASQPQRSFGDFSVLRIRPGDDGETLDWLAAPGCPISQGTVTITTTGDQQHLTRGDSRPATEMKSACAAKEEVVWTADLMAGVTSYGMTADGRLVLEGSGVPVLAVFARVD